MGLPLLTVGVEALAHGLRRRDRRRLYSRARLLADDTGSPLVVVGDGAAAMEHPCGDALDPDADPDIVRVSHPGCVDPRGCALCGSPPIDLYYVHEPLAWPPRPLAECPMSFIPVRDGAAVVFVSGGLERAPDEPSLVRAWTEIRRAAGSDDRVFVSHARAWGRWASVFARHRFAIERAPPAGPLVYRALTTPRAPGLAETRGRR